FDEARQALAEQTAEHRADLRRRANTIVNDDGHVPPADRGAGLLAPHSGAPELMSDTLDGARVLRSPSQSTAPTPATLDASSSGAAPLADIPSTAGESTDDVVIASAEVYPPRNKGAADFATLFTLREPEPAHPGTTSQEVPTLFTGRRSLFDPRLLDPATSLGPVPPRWSRDDLLSAAFLVFDSMATGDTGAESSAETVPGERADGHLVGRGTFKDIEVEVTVEGGRITGVRATQLPPNPATAVATAPAPAGVLGLHAPSPVPGPLDGAGTAEPHGAQAEDGDGVPERVAAVPAHDDGDAPVTASNGVRVVSADAGGVLPEKYYWLRLINPYREPGGAPDSVAVARAVDTSLAAPDGSVYQADLDQDGWSPEGAVSGLWGSLRDYRNLDPYPVDGPAAVVEAMSQAPLGAQGMVVIASGEGEITHVINVAHDEYGVILLDGQTGALAPMPTVAVSFLPTTEGIPGFPLVSAVDSDGGESGAVQPTAQRWTYQEFLERMRPLREYADNAEDRTVRDIELAIISAPGADSPLGYVRGSHGHAALAVRLPGSLHPVVLGFYPQDDAGLPLYVPGEIREEPRSWVTAPVARITGVYRINADQLRNANLYADQNFNARYALLGYNCVTFVREFAVVAAGRDPGAGMVINRPDGLIAAMAKNADWRWADNETPVTGLTDQDRIRAEEASASLSELDKDESHVVRTWARYQVAFDHQRPLLTIKEWHSESPTEAHSGRLQLLADFTELIAHEMYLHGEDAARAMSQRLGTDYGTLRQRPADALQRLEDWRKASDLPGKPPSSELRKINTAVARLVGHEDDPRLLSHALDVVRAWQTVKAGKSARWAAVEQLRVYLEDALKQRTSERVAPSASAAGSSGAAGEGDDRTPGSAGVRRFGEKSKSTSRDIDARLTGVPSKFDQDNVLRGPAGSFPTDITAFPVRVPRPGHADLTSDGHRSEAGTEKSVPSSVHQVPDADAVWRSVMGSNPQTAPVRSIESVLAGMGPVPPLEKALGKHAERPTALAGSTKSSSGASDSADGPTALRTGEDESASVGYNRPTPKPSSTLAEPAPTSVTSRRNEEKGARRERSTLGAPGSWAESRARAKPVAVDAERITPIDPGRLPATADRIRLDARRFQDVSGEWISDASIRIHLEPQPGVTPEQTDFLAERLTETASRINGHLPELPDGSVFHLDVEFSPSPDEAHLVLRVYGEGGGATSAADVHVAGAQNQLVRVLRDALGLADNAHVPGAFLAGQAPEPATYSPDHVSGAIADATVLSARDLADIAAVFRSGQKIENYRHPSAGRDPSTDAVRAGNEPTSTSANPDTGDLSPGPAPRDYPWYLDHGALGDSEIWNVPEWKPSRAEMWAQAVASHIADDAIREAVVPAVRTMLASSDREEWKKFLSKGFTLVAGKHLVWVRPEIAGVRPPSGRLTDERRYEGDRQVRVPAQVTSVSGSRTTTSTLSSWILDAVNLALKSVRTAPVTVQIGQSAATTKGASAQRTVKATHITVAEWGAYSGGTAETRFRVFVDGKDVDDGKQDGRVGDVVVLRDLDVAFPPALAAKFVEVHEPKSKGEQSPHEDAQRPVGTPLYIGAIDVVALITGLHAALLAGGLPASAVRDVMLQLEPWLGETDLRKRADWLFSSGIVTPAITVDLPWGKSFRASFTIRAGIESLQFLGYTQPGVTRGFNGIATNRSRAVDGTARADLTVATLMTGLSDGQSSATGLGRGPDVRITGYGTRSAGHSVSSSTTRHTEFKFKTPQITYASGVAVTVSVTSAKHEIPDVHGTVQAELGTMWRGRPQAADFERRVLGAVHTAEFQPPEVPAATDVPPEPGPVVETQPHVQALLRESGARLTRNFVRPRELDEALPAPHPREPLALASRRGADFTATLGLPGAELIQNHFLAALKEDVARRGGKSKVTAEDWVTVERDLSSYFGRPALERLLGRLFAGVRQTIWVGNQPYRLSVRGHLRERLPDDESAEMDVESLIGAGGGVSGYRGTRWGAHAVFGFGATIGWPKKFNLQIGSFGLFAEYSKGRQTSFEVGNKSSRRIKPQTGVDVHKYNIVYELKLTPLKAYRDRKEVLRKPAREPGARTETWWVHRSGDLVAQILVPHAFVPTEPVTRADADRVGTVNWPARGVKLDFARGGTAGVAPAFIHMPELAKLGAQLYAQLNGLDKDSKYTGWIKDELWPDEIHDLANPDVLDTAFNDMVGRFGHEDSLPDRKGFKQGIRLRLTAYATSEPAKMALPVNIVDTKDSGDSQGLLKGVGTEHGVFGILGGQPSVLGPQPGQTSLDHHTIQGPLSSVGTGHLSGHIRGWMSEGGIENHRETFEHVAKNKAIYKGSPYSLTAVPVFELTMIRWKGSKREEVTGYLSVADGLQLLIPPRIMEDLWTIPTDGQAASGSPELPTIPKVGEEAVQLLDRFEEEEVSQATADIAGKDRTEPGRASVTEPTGDDDTPQGEDASEEASAEGPTTPARVERDYLTSDIAGGIGRAERVSADDVMDVITARLQAHGVLPDGPLNDNPLPNPLNRALHGLFSSRALENAWPLLAGTGIWAWLPVPGFMGAISYIWVRVRVEDLVPAHKHRLRPDVKLNVATSATSRVIVDDGELWSAGADVRIRTGAFHPSGRDGIELSLGYRSTSSRTKTQSRQQSHMYDADPQESAEEFTHRAVFSVEVGGTTELPRIMDLPITWVHQGLLGIAGLELFDARETVARMLNEHRSWTWFEGDGRADGDVRILVSSDLVGPVGPQPGVPLHRVYGEEPKWVEPSDVIPETLPEELLHRLNPLGFPAAAALERWAALAASPASHKPELQTADAWKVQGNDFTTTSGPQYAHFTGTGMTKANVIRLLTHTYEVPVDGRLVRVGIHLDSATVIGPPGGVAFDAARYTKEESETTYSGSDSSGWQFNAGPLTTAAAGDNSVFANMLGGWRVAQGNGGSYRDTDNDENARTGRVKRAFRYYQFDLTLVLHGPRRTLEVKAPTGLFGMLPLDRVGGQLLGGLETKLPRLFTNLSPVSAGEEKGDAGTGTATVPDASEARLAAEGTALPDQSAALIASEGERAVASGEGSPVSSVSESILDTLTGRNAQGVTGPATPPAVASASGSQVLGVTPAPEPRQATALDDLSEALAHLRNVHSDVLRHADGAGGHRQAFGFPADRLKEAIDWVEAAERQVKDLLDVDLAATNRELYLQNPAVGGSGNSDSARELLRHLRSRESSATASGDRVGHVDVADASDSPQGVVESGRTAPSGRAPVGGAGLFRRSPVVDLPGWRVAAEEFERELARHAYQDDEARAAVSDSLRRLVEVLRDHSGLDEDTVLRSFVRDDETYAGQVGTALSSDEIRQMITSGSTREMYTAFFNAAFENAEAEVTLKTVLNDVLTRADWERARSLGLNGEALHDLHVVMHGTRGRVSRALLRTVAPDYARLFGADDAFSLGNIVFRGDGWLKDSAELLASRASRIKVGEEERIRMRRTPGYYEDAGAGLSSREIEFLRRKQDLLIPVGISTEEVPLNTLAFDSDGFPILHEVWKQPGVIDVKVEGKALRQRFTVTNVVKVLKQTQKLGDLGSDHPLMWEEGRLRFTVSHSSWAEDLASRGILTLTGISGTTALLLSAFRWLKVPGVAESHFLKGLIGWMGVHGDHSLYEILRGAEMAGYTGVDGGRVDLTDGPSMYRTLGRLGRGFERSRLITAPDGLPGGDLPDETVYLDRVSQGQSRRFIPGFRQHYDDIVEEMKALQNGRGGLLEQWLAGNGLNLQGLLGRVSEARMFALYVYTGVHHRPISQLMAATRWSNATPFAPDMAHATTRHMAREVIANLMVAESPDLPEYLDDVELKKGYKTYLLECLKIREAKLGGLKPDADPDKIRTEFRDRLYRRLDQILPDLMVEWRLHAEMVTAALRALPGVKDVTVWRGSWAVGGDSLVSSFLRAVPVGYNAPVITVDDFTSASRSRLVAHRFMRAQQPTAMSHPVVLELRLSGAFGRDISYLSRSREEEEVMFLPGAQFRVTGRSWVVEEGRRFELIVAEEVSSEEAASRGVSGAAGVALPMNAAPGQAPAVPTADALAAEEAPALPDDDSRQLSVEEQVLAVLTGDTPHDALTPEPSRAVPIESPSLRARVAAPADPMVHSEHGADGIADEAAADSPVSRSVSAEFGGLPGGPEGRAPGGRSPYPPLPSPASLGASSAAFETMPLPGGGSELVGSGAGTGPLDVGVGTGASGGEEVVARAEVSAPPRPEEDPGRWIPWAGAGPGLRHRGFEALRVRLENWRYESRAVVRVFFDGQQAPDGGTPTEPEMREVARQAQLGVDEHYNTGLRLPNGDRLRVVVQRVDRRADAHHVINLHTDFGRPDAANWSVTMHRSVMAHEIGHLLGLPDEYREARWDKRPVHGDDALMAGHLVDRRGRAVVDVDWLVSGGTFGTKVIPARHLRMLGAVFDQAWGTTGLRVVDGTVFATEDAVTPRGDGLPARAHFSVEVRQAVLHGDVRTGRVGVLSPRGLSSRPRPVREGEAANPNGTFRALLPAAGGPVSGLRSDTGGHARAGDIAVPAVRQPSTQMMFPAHWAEDDAVYAAEQAYLDALGDGRIVAVPGRPGAFTFEGVYGGVRIEGNLKDGDFTGFRPSDDQSGLLPPAYMPAPGETEAKGPAFGLRVEDIAAYGDRRTRTGGYNPPPLTSELRSYGPIVVPGAQFDNGTYRAHIYFLDPNIRPGDLKVALWSRWRLHADGWGTVLFPKDWSRDMVQDAVEMAHAWALANAPQRIKPMGEGRYFWVGIGNGVRIEGLVRDGQHVAYRPAAVQPHLRWPDESPVGITAPRSLGQPHLHAQQVLFANGQRGILITADVRMTPRRGVRANPVALLLDRLKTKIARTYHSLDWRGGTVVGFSVVHTEQPEAAALEIPVGRSQRSDRELPKLLTKIFGVGPDWRRIRALARAVLDQEPMPTFEPPFGVDTPDARAAIEEATRAGDLLAGPITLREPDPADPGTTTETVPTVLSSVAGKVFAPGVEPVIHPEGTVLPRWWRRDDVLAAAYTIYSLKAAGSIDPADSRFKILQEEADGSAVVEGTFEDVVVTATIDGGQITAVRATPASDPGPLADGDVTMADSPYNSPAAMNEPAAAAARTDDPVHTDDTTTPVDGAHDGALGAQQSAPESLLAPPALDALWAAVERGPEAERGTRPAPGTPLSTETQAHQAADSRGGRPGSEDVQVWMASPEDAMRKGLQDTLASARAQSPRDPEREITALAGDRPRLGPGAHVAVSGTVEDDRRFGPLVGPKAVKPTERDAGHLW
ncbi:hypothetical protein ACFYOH_43190, partial [Streptomyces sp. NPDC007856]